MYCETKQISKQQKKENLPCSNQVFIISYFIIFVSPTLLGWVFQTKIPLKKNKWTKLFHVEYQKKEKENVFLQLLIDISKHCPDE